MNKAREKLREELVQAGAKPSEVDELGLIAARLSLLKAVPGQKPVWVKVLKPVASAVPALVVGAAIVILAQSVSPTSWLYPIQKLSDAVAIDVNPGYRVTVMMRRAQQVNELTENHASSSMILATLNSYDTEAANYKGMPHTSYAAFEYCRSNLEQAAAMAPNGVRQAINTSLKNLNAT